MSDNRDLETRIKSAEEILNGTFGISKQQQGEGSNRYLDLESLINAYKEEASSKEVTEQFLSIAKAIRQMRSSYLPIDFFINSDTNQFDVDFSNTVATQESYENAFMRMLGMPSVGLTEFGLTQEDSEIRSSQTLKAIDPITGNALNLSYQEVKNTILNERQKNRDSRKFLINNSIYNISEKTESELAGNTISIRNLSMDEIANLLDTIVDRATNQLFDKSTGEIATFTPTEIMRTSETEPFLDPYTGNAIGTTKIEELHNNSSLEEVKVGIASISQDLWKFSYLLLPPIQNIEISRYINEPDKIISTPFSSVKNRKINNSNIRPTLLESVIRIRLDKISGSNTFLKSDDSNIDDFSINYEIGSESGGVEVIPDNFGVLESLFILRLRSAISGLAQKLYSDIDIMINEMEKSRRLPIDEDASTGQVENIASNEAAVQMTGTEEQAPDEAISENSLLVLQQQKLIEDSILFLLGDNSEVMDLQSQTQRSSSMHNSHMMSGLISVIDVPRKRIDEDLKKIIESRNKQAAINIEKKAQEIGVILGTDIGIGTIDLAVFALAMFTISEEGLLGLLSKSQYDRIKNGEFKNLLPGDGDKIDTVDALNEFTQLVIDGYKVFINELDNDERRD
jgi:hypothetical protein